jgi:hypothetical protein
MAVVDSTAISRNSSASSFISCSLDGGELGLDAMVGESKGERTGADLPKIPSVKRQTRLLCSCLSERGDPIPLLVIPSVSFFDSFFGHTLFPPPGFSASATQQVLQQTASMMMVAEGDRTAPHMRFFGQFSEMSAATTIQCAMRRHDCFCANREHYLATLVHLQNMIERSEKSLLHK